MHAAVDILALVAVVGFVAAGARRMGWSEPLLLVVVGVGLSFVPNVLEIALTPDLVLVGLLPPLLYAAAIRTSLVDIRANRRAIALLSVGAVAFSALAVGVVAWWIVPGLGWPRVSRSVPWSRHRTRSRRPPWAAASGCRGASSRSSRAKAWSTTRPRWSH